MQTATHIPQDRRWLIVSFTLLGILTCLLFFALTFTSLFDPSSVPIPYGRHTGLSPVLVAVLIGYLMLAFVTWVMLPAPWTHEVWRRSIFGLGYRTRRINWVLTFTSILAVMMFALMLGNSTFHRLRTYYPPRYKASNSETYSQENRRQTELIAWQEAVRTENRAAALSLLICFAGVAGYGTWWLRTRPQIPVINQQDNNGPWWARQY